MKKLAVVVVLAAIGFAYTYWPRLNDVETGRTPEYPDLQALELSKGEAAVVQAARRAVESLPRWRLVGVASGPAGTAIQAEAKTLVLRFTDEVTIRVKREAGKTRLSVRSRSRLGRVDFGQNARNIRAFLAAFQRELGG